MKNRRTFVYAFIYRSSSKKFKKYFIQGRSLLVYESTLYIFKFTNVSDLKKKSTQIFTLTKFKYYIFLICIVDLQNNNLKLF